MAPSSIISIIMPTYNGEKYIKEAVESIQSQTYSEWELIIVDDQSTDNTSTIIRNFACHDDRIKIIEHEMNRKLPGALNTGFAVAKGKYLTWTSDDNLYQPNALQEMLTYLDCHPKISFVYSDFTIINEFCVPIERVNVPAVEQLLFRNIIGPCFLYRLCVQEKIGYYSEDMFLVEDYDYWLRVSNNFHMAPLHKNLYRFRRHQDSLSNNKQREVMMADYMVRQKHLALIKWASKTQKGKAYLYLAMKGKELKSKKKVLKCLYLALLSNFLLIRSSVFLGLLLYSFFGEKVFKASQKAYDALRFARG